MQYIHDSHNFCHRDLKSENLLLDEEFRIKIADFGCAASTRDGLISDEENEPRGTDQYMAPERLQGSPYDGEKEDIFAWGVILF